MIKTCYFTIMKGSFPSLSLIFTTNPFSIKYFTVSKCSLHETIIIEIVDRNDQNVLFTKKVLTTMPHWIIGSTTLNKKVHALNQNL